MADSPIVFLSVKRLSSAKDIQKNWETSWGSFDRDFSRTIAVDISVRNMRSKEEEDVQIEVLFVAKPLSGSIRWVFDRSVETVKLQQNSTYHTVKLSKTLDASVQNYAALGERYESGDRIDGYIVRILQGEQIVKVAASSNPLKIIGSDQKQTDQIIASGNNE